MVIGVGGVCPGPWLKPQSITKASDISFTSALIKVWLSFLCTTYSHPPTPIHHLPLYTTYPYTPPTPIHHLPLYTTYPYTPPTPIHHLPLYTTYPYTPPTPIHHLPLYTTYPYTPPTPIHHLPTHHPLVLM